MRLLILIFITGAMAWGLVACAQAASDKVMILQDENFFLQDEIKKLQAELIDKDNALKKMLIEREVARDNLDAVARQKEALEGKVDALQKMILARDEGFPAQVEQAALPYRIQMQDMARELKGMAMALEQTKAHVAELVKARAALEQKAELFIGEKMSLVGSLRKVSEERDDLKSRMDGAIADARASADAKVKDFQVRLAAEQTLAQEKVFQAKRPLEEKLALMQAQDKVKEAALRENAAAQVRKVDEAYAVQIKDLKQQLSACRQASSLK